MQIELEPGLVVQRYRFHEAAIEARTRRRLPATDLGYLLHKSPGRVHSFDLTFGRAHVFYPEATAERCTAALLLEVDPIGLVRDRKGPSGDQRALEQYVNDRPYVVSSFTSVALARVLGPALAGRSKERQELADTRLRCRAWTREHGEDPAEIRDWVWPG